MIIQEEYEKRCITTSDINQHLPVIKYYADQCKHVTEIGVRNCNSLYALLASSAEKVVAIDIVKVWTPTVDKLTFIHADSLLIQIEPTDFLFIDSYHTYTQLKTELQLHSSQVSKYIGFHDTYTYGLTGEDGQHGLLKAIDEFLSDNQNWYITHQTTINNGLTILQRKLAQ